MSQSSQADGSHEQSPSQPPPPPPPMYSQLQEPVQQDDSYPSLHQGSSGQAHIPAKQLAEPQSQ